MASAASAATQTPPPPFVPGEPPANPYASGTEIGAYLRGLQGLTAGPTRAYVHPKVISFASSGERADWRAHMPDADTRDTFSGFCCANKGGSHTWIGLFSVPTGSMMGYDWKDTPWHCYTVALVSNPAGERVLVFWDCDPGQDDAGKTRAKDVLFGKQRSFVRYLREERRFGKLDIWYNQDDTFSGRGKCLFLSAVKARDWATLGDLPFQDADDPRAKGCRKLARL